MYSDVTVTVSSSIVRDIESGFAVLEMARIIGGAADEIVDEHLEILITTSNTIEWLFLLEEDLLVDEGALCFFLAKKIGWYSEVLEAIKEDYPDPIDAITDFHETLEDFIAGEAIDPDIFKETNNFLVLVSKKILEHFTNIHKRAKHSRGEHESQ